LPDLLVAVRVHAAQRLELRELLDRQIRLIEIVLLNHAEVVPCEGVCRFQADGLAECLSRLLESLQGDEGQGPYKISYVLDKETVPPTKAIQRHLRRHKLSARVIRSHDRYLDLLPVRASKGLAVRYFALRWDIPIERVLVAGDSGNDEEMLTGNTLGVVVGNHDPELEHLRGNPRIHFADGAYARGILEGIEHYDFLGRIVVPEEGEEARATLPASPA